MGKRWANDVAAGLLVTAFGAAGMVVFFWFTVPMLQIALGVMFLGVAVALFGAFEYFASRASTARATEPRN